MEAAIAAWHHHLLQSSKLSAKTISEYIHDVTRFAVWLQDQQRTASLDELTVGDARDYGTPC
jgi:site-specific recombinase XerD